MYNELNNTRAACDSLSREKVNLVTHLASNEQSMVHHPFNISTHKNTGLTTEKKRDDSTAAMFYPPCFNRFYKFHLFLFFFSELKRRGPNISEK
jgi:hypothetical protein